jgi:hypothetical protein
VKRFVVVTEDLWTDAKFLKLSTDARCIFMWSWMPPHSNVCGLYRCSLRDLERALGPSLADESIGRRGRVEHALDELSSAHMLHFDSHNEVLWVVNRVKHAARTPKSVAYMQKELRAIPDSPLVDRFLTRWGSFLGLLGKLESPSV